MATARPHQLAGEAARRSSLAPSPKLMGSSTAQGCRCRHAAAQPRGSRLPVRHPHPRIAAWRGAHTSASGAFSLIRPYVLEHAVERPLARVEDLPAGDLRKLLQLGLV